MASITTAPTSSSTSEPTNGQSYRGPFAIMTVLFFLWGFMTVFNDILIPRLKEAFTLDYTHAMLVQFAFFGAYFVGSLLYFIISAVTGDPIARIGYKNGVVIGLLISALGSAIFWPAANLAPRSLMISPGDLQDVPTLAGKLSEHKDPVSGFVYQHLSDSTQKMLSQSGPELSKALAQDLTAIVDGPGIYDEQLFSSVTLEPTTKEMVEQLKHGKLTAVSHLNRALLEDAYRHQVNRNLT